MNTWQAASDKALQARGEWAQSLRQQRIVVCLLLGACFALRLGWGVAFPTMIHYDNVFQSLEQAHRLVFGYGTMVQEYQIGMRNWLFPGFIAGLMWLCKQFSSSAVLYLTVIKAVMSAVSLIPVYVTYQLARRIAPFGRAIAVSMLPAFWYEAVLFAPTTFFGPFAANLFVLACYWVLCADQAVNASRVRALAAGLLLAVVSIVRFHLLPEVAFALWIIWRYRPAWRRDVMVCFLAAFLLFGLLDWLTWSYPFQSIIANVKFNIVEHIAAKRFGDAPFYWYAVLLWRHLYILIVPIVVVLVMTAKRYPLLLGAIVINLFSFSVIGHKEYRFIILTVTVWPILMALGMVELMQRSVKWKRWMMRLLMFMLVGASIPAGALYMRHLVHGQVLAATLQAGEWARDHYNGQIAALVVDDDHGHGLTDFYQLGGYSYFNVDAPLVVHDFAHMVVAQAQSPYPTLLMTDKSLNINGIDKVLCRGRYCVYATQHKLQWY